MTVATSVRETHDSCGYTVGFIGEGPSRVGGEVNGCEGSAEDVGDCVGYGRVGPAGRRRRGAAGWTGKPCGPRVYRLRRQQSPGGGDRRAGLSNRTAPGRTPYLSRRASRRRLWVLFARRSETLSKSPKSIAAMANLIGRVVRHPLGGNTVGFIGEGPSRVGGEVNRRQRGGCWRLRGPRELRDGPANLARLGVSLQCRGACGPVEPHGTRAHALPERRAEGGTFRDRSRGS